MKKAIIIFLLAVSFNYVNAQSFYTKNATISFFSVTSIENIKADNTQVMSVLNTKTGEMQFSLLQKGFHFVKPLMEEHFNENYMESDKYPKATFKGKITDITKVDFTKDGTYKVTVTGDLTMHGVTKNIITPGTILINKGNISANSSFSILPSDYNIVIPKLAQKAIQKEIDVTVTCNFDHKQ